MKKSLLRWVTFHDTSTPVNITMPVSRTIRADMPSTPSLSAILPPISRRQSMYLPWVDSLTTHSSGMSSSQSHERSNSKRSTLVWPTNSSIDVCRVPNVSVWPANTYIESAMVTSATTVATHLIASRRSPGTASNTAAPASGRTIRAKSTYELKVSTAMRCPRTGSGRRLSRGAAKRRPRRGAARGRPSLRSPCHK